MRVLSPDSRSSLAAEYALGTLCGLARTRFVRLLKNDADLRAQVGFWQERFSEFATQLPPVAPREVVWASLERSLASDAGKVVPLRLKRAPATNATTSNNHLGLWQSWAAVASITSAVLGMGFWLEAVHSTRLQAEVETAQTKPMPYLALIQPPGGDARWAVSMYPEKNLMRVSVSGRHMPVDRSRSLELWMLDNQGKPHSLGVLPMDVSKPHDMAMPKLPAELLGNTLSLAVSEEPRGGSPTGSPTGKVLGAMPAVRPIY